MMKENDYLLVYDPVPCDMLEDIYITPCITASGFPKCGLYFELIKSIIIDGERISKNNGICRISMERPEYITCFGINDFLLTDEQKAILCEQLTKPIYSWSSLWWKLYDTINDIHWHDSDGIDKFVSIPFYDETNIPPIPDYTRLK